MPGKAGWQEHSRNMPSSKSREERISEELWAGEVLGLLREVAAEVKSDKDN